MSKENVKIARAAYDAFNRGDIGAVLERCAPDIEWHDAGTFDTGPVKGSEAVRAYFETVLDPWEDLRREPEEIIDVGDDRVLVHFRLTGRGKGSGIEVDLRGSDLMTLQAGVAVRWVSYPDRGQALKAAGLSE
jgi:uncharacterized protein